MEQNDFSDVLDMEYLLLSDASSIAERNESRNSENNCNFLLCFHLSYFYVVICSVAMSS